MVSHTRQHAASQTLDGVPYTDDIVEYTLSCVHALAPGIDTAPVSTHIRQVFGGQSVYVVQQDRKRRNEAIRRDHHAGERVPLLMRRYGLSRATILRILSGG